MKLNPKNILFGDDSEKKGPVLLAVTPPRAGERTLLGVENLLQSIAVPEPFSLELAGDMDGAILMARCLDGEVVRGQLSAHYPQAGVHDLTEDEDPLRFDEGSEQAWSMTLRADGPEYVPLRTFRDDDLLDPGSDPLIALLGALTALRPGERIVARLLLRSLGPDWSQPHMDKAHKRPGMEPREPAYTYQTKPLQMDGMTMAVLGIGALAALKGYLWVQDGEIWKAALLATGTALGLVAGGWGWWRWKKARKRVEDPLLIKEKVSRIAFDAELQVTAVMPRTTRPQRAGELLGPVAAAYRHYDNPAGARFKVGRVKPAVPDPLMLHPAGPGLFGRRSVLGVREVASLWHPPGAGDETPLVERSGARARAILGQRRSTIDLRETILKGGVLLVSTSQGTVGRDVAALVGASLLNLVDAVIREQGSVSLNERRGALVVVDEMQSMPGVDYESMLSELGKFGASFILATQSLAKLDDLSRTMRDTLLANVGCLAVFQVAGSDARHLVWELGKDRVSEDDMVSLPVHHCYVRATVGTDRMPAFSMMVRKPEEGDPSVAARIRAAASAYTLSARQVAYGEAEAEKKVEDYRRGVDDLKKDGDPAPKKAGA